MIFSFVSTKNKAGKGYAASVFSKNDPLKYVHHQFARRLTECGHFLLGYNGSQSKYDKHPVLGVSPKEINHILSEAFQKHNPEIPVQVEKEEIIKSLEDGCHVLISDVRRHREFMWLNDVATKFGTKHHLIEIVPTGEQLKKARLDRWTNGIEPCGFKVWELQDRSVLFNDGTSEFEKVVVRTVEALLSGKKRVIDPL